MKEQPVRWVNFKLSISSQVGQILIAVDIATAILDRLLHHATTINVKGESFRLKEKRKAGLLNNQALAKTEEETAA